MFETISVEDHKMKNDSLALNDPILSGTDESSQWLRWQTVSHEKLADCKIFSVNKILASSKFDSESTRNFFTLTCGAWVNIIAVNDKSQLIMVEQYRHGIEELTLELPGGSVDDTDIDPHEAARRELREETGYLANTWSMLGTNHPNPALQNNLCYTYLAEGAYQIEQPKFDGTGTERVRTRFVDLCDIGALVLDGTISHALVITALHFLTLRRPELILNAPHLVAK